MPAFRDTERGWDQSVLPIQRLDDRVKRPNKLLQPLELVIHDCWFAARSLCSVRPIVRRARVASAGSGSLIFASVFSFLSAVASASRNSLGPNSLSLRFLFVMVFTG